MIRLVVLDFDGVLVESNDVKARAFSKLAARWPHVAAELMRHHDENVTSPRRSKFERWAEILGRAGDRVLIDEMSARFSEEVVEGIVRAPEVAGTSAFLRTFAPRLPLYVASVTPQDELRRILRARGILHHLRDAFGDPPMRKQDAIREAVRREGARSEEAVLIGDAPSDLRAAQEAGVRFIARESGAPFPSGDFPRCKDMRDAADIVHDWMGEGP